MSWNHRMWCQITGLPLLQINFHKNLHLFVLCSFPYIVIQFLTLDQTFEVSKLSSSGKLMVPRRIIVFWSLGVCQSTSLKPRTVITVWWATGTPLCALENHESGDEAQDVRLPFGRISVVNLNRGPCVLGFFCGPPCVFLTSCPGWVECHLLSCWRQEHPPGVQNTSRASTLRRHSVQQQWTGRVSTSIWLRKIH